MTTLTNEELAEIEKRHAKAEAYYTELEAKRREGREAGPWDLRPLEHMHRAALLAHLRSQTPPQAVTGLTRRDDLHNVIARTMKQPVYNSSEICDAVEQYLERLPASPAPTPTPLTQDERRTPGTIEVCPSCRESTLLWDPQKGVCGGGASYHMCPMMQAHRDRLSASPTAMKGEA